MSAQEQPVNGASTHKVTVVSILFDHDSHQVSLAMKEVTIAVAQMMVHEATVQLDIMRRQAAAMELRKQLAEAQTNAALAASIRMGR